jgi:alpha-amylase
MRRKGRKGRKRRKRFSVLSAFSALTALACSDELSAPPPGNPPPERPSLAETYRPSGRMAAGDVFVHLFEWKWTDIATECENVLGPAGVAAVQVSPPQEHSLEPPDYPWSQRYQPVSYSIGRSRSGTDLEFADMVDRCDAAGVGIIVDAVVNHMTNLPSPGVGSNGTGYSKYEYPGLYTAADFHSPCLVSNYQDAANVQDCELLSLPDLHTGLASVRQKIGGYLVFLARIGVAGFRIDAAKHIQQVELDDIVSRMNRRLEAENWPLPYLFLEVIGGAGEALSPRDYFGVGYSSGGASDITEFTFVGVGDKFRGVGGQFLAQLNPDGPPGSRFSEAAWGLMPSDKAVVFLQNHDTQHSCGLSYRDGDVFRLANVWMLAQPYGFPSLLSSYAFNCPAQNFMGPPSDAGGNTSDVVCASSLESAEVGDWVCEHRDRYLLSMVAFRRVVAGTAITQWWDNGANAIAFSRGDKGFVAINRESVTLDATVMTGLPPGTYCDRLTGGLVEGACAGIVVVVQDDGLVDLLLASGTAIAIDVETAIVD